MRLTGTLDQRIGRHLAAAGAGFLALVMTPAHAQAGKDRPAATIKVGEPAGFSSLTDAQSAVVDVYFGNRRLGDTQVSFLPGSISFADPAKLVALLPDIANPEAVQAALAAADLPSNSRLVCSPGTDPMLCGRLAPDIVGVIFDQEHFRVDIFVNPRMLAVRQAVVRQYLPQPEGGLSIVDAIGVVLSGSSDGPQTYNLQDHFILGDADRRLRADLAYASGFGVQADRLVLEMDKPGWRYTAGAFWAPGTDLIGRRKMLGLGIETQFDTRLDRDELQGSPLVVFLGQRSRVDIMRDGRVLTSRIYEAGNQCLETSGLPDGSYEVTLRIEDAGGAKREELRFFTKNPLIAPAGHAIYFAYAGVLANDATSEFISPTGTPFLQAGTGRRLGAHFAVDATVLTTDRTLLGEVGAYYIGKRAQIRLAAIGSSTGVYGGLLQLSSQGNSRFNFNFDLRHIRIGGHPLLSDPDPTSIVAGSLPDRNPSLLPVAISTFTQLAGNAMYNLPSAQIGVAATYRRMNSQPTDYSIGPTLRWDFLRRGALRMSFNTELAFTDQGRSGFAGISLQLLGDRSALSGSMGMRSSNLEGDPNRTAPVGAINGTLQVNNFAGGDLNLGAGYEHDLESDVAGASANLRSDKATFTGDVIHDIGGNDSTQYSLGFQTSVAVRGGAVALEGRNQNESMVVVNIDGASTANRFEVLVNDSPVGAVHGGGSLAVSLTPYRQYDVRIRPAGGEPVNYDGAARRIGLYPGNVARLAWTAKPMIAMFGRLVFPEGQPIASASVTAEGGIGETDGNGYFQIEAAQGSELKVALPDSRSCRVQLPNVSVAQGYAPLGTLTCAPDRPPFRLASAAAP